MRIFDRRRVESYCGPTTLYHVIAEILPWVIFLVTVIVLVAVWGRIPDQIPLQSDGRGTITRWGERSSLIWLGAVYLALLLLLGILSWFPGSWNKSFRIRFLGRNISQASTVRDYRLLRDCLGDMRISVSILFSAALLLSALAPAVVAGPLFPVGVIALIAVPLLRYFLRRTLWS